MGFTLHMHGQYHSKWRKISQEFSEKPVTKQGFSMSLLLLFNVALEVLDGAEDKKNTGKENK